MKCPYCGFYKTQRKTEVNFRTYSCPRCDYLFEVSFARVYLDLALSVPLSSFIYTPILLVINYYLAKAIFNPVDSFLPFGVFLMFLLLLTALLLFFTYYMISGRSSRIFIVKVETNTSFLSSIFRINPLLKIATYVIIASIFAVIFF